MKRFLLVAGLICCAHTFAVQAEEKHEHPAASPTNPAFDKLKSLAGTWVATDEKGQPTEQVVSIIKVTAGGSAVHETLFPGEPHEMISVYTPEGKDVLMTHYCMLGNQPQMKASPNSASNKIDFEFAGGTNLDPKKDKHMHSAVLTFVDADHIQIEGTAWENGKPSKDSCGVMKLARKK